MKRSAGLDVSLSTTAICIVDNLAGRPIGKAAPANISRDPTTEVWGVLYRINRRAAVKLDASEGVPGRRYRALWLEAEDIHANRITPTFTYIAEGNPTDGNPSLRYLTLLRVGARTHNLPEHWLRFLDEVRHAERVIADKHVLARCLLAVSARWSGVAASTSWRGLAQRSEGRGRAPST